MSAKTIKDSKGRDSYGLPPRAAALIKRLAISDKETADSFRSSFEHLTKLIYEKDLALDMATSYMDYVMDFSERLHTEADGTPSCYDKVEEARNNVIPEDKEL